MSKNEDQAKVFFKLTTAEGFDLHTGSTINYRQALARATPVRPLQTGEPRLCSPTVLHAASEPRLTFTGLHRERLGLAQLAMFRVAGIPLVSDGRKSGFQELRVIEELSAPVWQEIVYGGGLAERIASAREIIANAKTIPWLKPAGPVALDLLQTLAAEHIEALIPWQRSDHATLDVLPVRALTDRQDALQVSARMYNARLTAAADAAAAAADADADAAADAADADAADADAAADAADAAADAADAADADAAAAAAADAAAADDDAGIINNLHWYVRPYRALYRAWRWEVAMAGKPSPYCPLIEMWSLGCLPLGLWDGEYLVYVPGTVE